MNLDRELVEGAEEWLVAPTAAPHGPALDDGFRLLEAGWSACRIGEWDHAIEGFSAALAAAAVAPGRRGGGALSAAVDVLRARAAIGLATSHAGAHVDERSRSQALDAFARCRRELLDGRDLAAAAVLQDDPEQARLLLDQAVDRCPGDPESMLWCGRALLLAGRVAEAAELLTDAASAIPDDPIVLMWLGRALAQPTDRPARTLLTGAVLAADRGLVAFAREQLQAAGAATADDAAARLVFAEVLRLSGQLHEAEAHATAALAFLHDNDPNRTVVLRSLVLSGCRLGHEQAWAAASELPGTVDDLVLLSALHRASGDEAGAQTALRDALGRDEARADVAIALARSIVGVPTEDALSADSAQAAEARSVLDFAEQQGAASAELFVVRAALAPEEAPEPHLLKAVGAGLPASMTWAAYAQELQFYFGDSEESFRALTEAYDLDPDDPDVLERLARSFLARGLYGDVVELLEPVVAPSDEERPIDVSPLLSGMLADALRMWDQPDEALPIAERALAGNPSDAILHAIRGSILADLERIPDAISELEVALDLGLVHGGATAQLVRLLSADQRGADAASVLAAIDLTDASFTRDLIAGLRSEGMYDESITVADRALTGLTSSEPARIDLLQERALSAWQAGADGRAIADLEQALAMRPTDSDARWLLAKVLGATNAVRALDMIVTEPEDDDDLDHSLLRADLTALVQGSSCAVLVLDRALERMPDAPALRLQRAAFLVDSGQLTEAQRELDSIEQLAGSNTDVDRVYVDVLLRTGRRSETVDRLQRILADQPDDWGAMVHLAGARLDAGDVEAAQALLEELPDDVRAAPDAREIEGFARFTQGDLEGAAALLEEVVSTTPDAVTAIDRLIAVCWKQGDDQRAERYLELLRAQPGGNVDYLVAHNAWLLGHTAEAIEHGRRYVGLDPDDAEGWRLLGAILEDSGDLEGAESALEQALRLRPDDTNVVNHLATVAISTGNAVQAVARLEMAIASPAAPDATLRLTLARALEELGRTDQAVAIALQLAQESPTDLARQRSIGELLATFDAYPHAIAIAETLLEGGPNSHGAALAGWLLNDAGRFADASRVLRRVGSLEPGGADAGWQLVWALRHLGAQAAQEWLDACVSVKRRDGGNSWLLRRMGEAQAQLGDEAGARARFEEARTLAGSSVQQIGLCLLDLGKFSTAVDYLMRSVAVTRRRPGSDRYDLALALLGDGREKFAVSEYERAIDETTRSSHPWAARGYVEVARIELGMLADRFPEVKRRMAAALGPLETALSDPSIADAFTAHPMFLQAVEDL